MHVLCLFKTIGSKTQWDSIEARKNPSEGEGNKRDFEGFVAKLCDCRWHIHSSGGQDEKCNNWTWRNVDHSTS